ncbi:MAG: NAD-dependent epimerase/dehydratase family protein, partial [Caulobacterales bacterium]|nr:NAD-dependent epimerase/dehydratase family protein [Caulobacterales bacterium]
MNGLALVTGGAGFMGAHLARALAARGTPVRLLDRAPPADPPAGAEVILGSVTDREAVAAAMEGVDTLFHLAAIAMLWGRDLDAVNAGGARTVLEGASAAGVRRVVHVSSLTTLVDRAGPRRPDTLDETRAIAPDRLCGPYPRSKRAGELIAQEAARAGLHVTIALPTLPVGPGDRGGTPPTRMIADFAAGRTPAALETSFNLVDVRDLAAGLIALAERGRAGERYLLAGEDLTMTELLAALEALTGRAMPRARVPYGLAWLAAAVDTHALAPLLDRPP